MSLRRVRSPVPPKITSRQDSALGSVDSLILKGAGCTAVLTSYLQLIEEIWRRDRPNPCARIRQLDGRHADSYGTRKSRAAPESGFAATEHFDSCRSRTARRTGPEPGFLSVRQWRSVDARIAPISGSMP